MLGNSRLRLGLGNNRGGKLPPNFEDALQWIPGKLNQDADTLGWYFEDKKGVRDGDVKLGSYLEFDGATYAEYANTGLGAGDFYMKWSGFINKNATADIIASHGGGFAGGKRVELFADSLDALGFAIDDNSLMSAYLILQGSEYSDGDFITLEVTRSGFGTDNISWVAENKTAKTSFSGITTDTKDFSSAQPVSVGAVYNVATPGYALFSPNGNAEFLFGETASNLKIESYFDEKAANSPTVFDASGNGNHGEIIGTIDRQESPFVYSHLNELGYNSGTVSDVVGDYLSTGVYIQDGVSAIEVTFRMNNIAATQLLFGAYLNGGNNFRFGVTSGGLWFAVSTGVTYGAADTGIHTMRISTDGSLYMDDVLIGADVVSGTPINELVLFAQNVGTIGTYADATIFRAKIWENDVLIRDFLPVEGGTMVDAVNSVTYLNQGVGDFADEYVPADQSALTKDVLGRTLENKGQVKYNIDVLGSSIANFNGIDNVIQTSTPIAQSHTIQIRTTPGTNSDLIGSGSTTTNDILYMIYNSKVRVHIWTDTGLNVADGTTVLSTSEAYDIKIVNDYDNKKIKVYINDVMELDFSYLGDYDLSSKSFFIGGRSSAGVFYNGVMESVRIQNGDIDVFESNFSETSGGIIYNKADSTKNGELLGTAATFWDTSDTARPDNLLDGFDLWENDTTGDYLRVPFDVNKASIKTDGDTITGYTWVSRNPFNKGGHNGAENTLKDQQAPALILATSSFAVNPRFDALGVPTKYGRSDLYNDYEEKHIQFADVDSIEPSVINLITYKEPQSGLILTKIYNYTKKDGYPFTFPMIMS